MHRQQLPENYILHMENGGEYIIKRKIAEGGFSLVYEAETPGGTAPVVIKEYFPAKGAERSATDNRVYPKKDFEESFRRNLEHFNNEGAIGGEIARYSFQTVSFTSCGNGYAVMREESEDMISIADLVARWSEEPPLPFTGNKKDADPVFVDLPRLKYSLRITESLLSVLSTVHKSGYLHLDISNKNCLWADADQTTGRTGVAFIADFGCSEGFSEGFYMPDYQMSYSPGFAAPEVQKGLEQLSPATDIYSVGMLFFFLCVGDPALERSHNRKRQVDREIAYLKLPQRIKDCLVDIICTATADKDCRYQSAYVMQEEIRKLDAMIPTHPINPDCSRSFTMYSLKSMLEGSLETHYSWAHELCDRRSIELPKIEESIFEPITWKAFSNDNDFLQWVLPEELYNSIKQKIDSSHDKQASLLGVMSGKYPNEWKNEFCHIIKQYGSKRFLEVSRTLLDNVSGFFENKELLFHVLGSEGQRLQDCYYYKGGRKSPYIGLAMFTMYALLGPDGFAKLIPSPSHTNLFDHV